MRSLTHPVISALAFLALVPGTGSADTRTIRVRDGNIAAIGDFRPPANPLLQAATRALGRSTSSKRIGDGVACIVRWERLALKITFANFGGHDACDPDHGLAQKAMIRGKGARRWQTGAGLRLGMDEDRVPTFHPNAERHRAGWWLAVTEVPYGVDCPCPYPSLKAKISHGRLSSFRLWLGYAGD